MDSNTPDLPTDSVEIEEPDDFKAMLTGAALIFVISFIPFAALTCCLPQLIGALLAVHLFTSKYGLTLTAGRGIKLGILTCLMGAMAAWAVAMGVYFLFDYQVGGREGEWIALTISEKVGGPEAVEKAREAMEQQKAQGMGLAQIAGGFVMAAVFACISGLIGGSIGSAIFKRGPKDA